MTFGEGGVGIAMPRRHAVDDLKPALRERGGVWWNDGASEPVPGAAEMFVSFERSLPAKR
jgi:hypothetical protein